MASITKEPNGRRTIQFIGADGKRRSIRLGKVSQRQAEQIKIKVENLNAAAITGHAPDEETSRWVAGLDNVLAEKLAKVRLIPSRESSTLADFLDRYFAMRSDAKPNTLIVWGHTRRNLLEHFGAEKSLAEITKGDAEEWRLYLVKLRLSDSTIRKRCGFAKQFFAHALKKKLIPANPFIDLKSSARANTSRYYFVTREEALEVIDACPDAQWRLLFALARFGGLRVPSEILKATWQDVDWERDRMTIHSPKTEHHPDGEQRVIPIFPEIRPYLEECFELAEEGDEHIITRYRHANVNLRTQLLRIIKRAGLKPWPKLFQNLRSTRETELAEVFPMHVVCAWIGNTEAIAAKHYLQITDEHFSQAVQNPVQQPRAAARRPPQPSLSEHKKTPVLQGCARDCDPLQPPQVEDRGLEPLTF